MEEMDLNKLSLFMDNEIVLIPEEANELLLANKFKKIADDLPLEANISEKPATENTVTKATSSAENMEELAIAISYEGEFKKGLLVIYQGEDMDNDIKAFLLKILQAVSHSLKDIALVSSVHLNSVPPTAINRMNPQKVLVFGRMSHPIIKLKEATYEITSHEDAEYLFADDLPVIFEDENLKRKLWKSLQVFFNISK